MEELNIPLVRLPNSAGLDLPQRATLESAGMDLLAGIDSSIVIDPGIHQVIPTGISIELPEGYEAQVRPRSGLAAKHGITILNEFDVFFCLLNHRCVCVCFVECFCFCCVLLNDVLF